MDIRKNEKIKLTNEQHTLETYIKNIESEIDKLRKQPSSEYTIHQIKKEENNLEIKKEQLNQNFARMQQIDSGIFDNELHFQNKIVKDEINKKKQVAKEKNKIMREKKEQDKIISKDYYMKQKQDDKKQRYMTKEYSKAYNHFIKADNSMPEYMKKNLKTMPNNKGYIWKSIIYFGHKKRERADKPFCVFERQKGNIFAIIEWNKDYYRIYHKKQNTNKKVLVYEETRKQKF